MHAFVPHALAAVVLLALTHVVLRPQRYLRRRPNLGFATLVALTGDAAVAERLVRAEIRRGARTRKDAVGAALARIRRERSR